MRCVIPSGGSFPVPIRRLYTCLPNPSSWLTVRTRATTTAVSYTAKTALLRRQPTPSSSHHGVAAGRDSWQHPWIKRGFLRCYCLSTMANGGRASFSTMGAFPVSVTLNESILFPWDRDDSDKHHPSWFIGAIDQGTSSTRFLLVTPEGRIGASAQMEHKQWFPSGKVGWHEHDPLEIWYNTVTCVNAVVDAVKATNRIPVDDKPLIRAIGITNQRETTLAWNVETGRPYYNAIVWDDLRTSQIAHDIGTDNGQPATTAASGGTNMSRNCGMDRLRPATGLPLSPYFAGTKVKWLLDHVPALRKDLREQPQNVKFGTIDTWLSYQLTGKEPPPQQRTSNVANTGGMIVTDVTNASRWLFLDIHQVAWDEQLIEQVCHPHNLPVTCLPVIHPSSHLYGTCTGLAALRDVPLAAILGDQHAALFGQCAFQPGQAKCTYGTGLFLMQNTGTEIVPSTHGLLTTIAYQIGRNGPVHYALEGSVSHAGSTIQWLRDQLGLIQSASESETVATPSNEGLYMVPAFAGLFAPRWRSDARACIVGMTSSHHRGHVVRAALEATCYQAREVFDAMAADSNVHLSQLNVDGGGTANSLLMQFQADILGLPVVKPSVMETTALGVAFAAGLAVGAWEDTSELSKLWSAADTYHPAMSENDRRKNWRGWHKAVERSLGWEDE